MLRSIRWLVVVPILLIVAATMVASCGGSSGCSGAYNSQGKWIPGACPASKPTPGLQLEAITICCGPPPLPTPTPSKTPKGPTPTPTPCPGATSTSVAINDTLQFNAQGTFVKGKQSVFEDITNSIGMVWTSSHKEILQPPTAGNGGLYTGAIQGCTCIGVTAAGIVSDPVGVAVATPVADCPLCSTPAPTAAPIESRGSRETHDGDRRAALAPLAGVVQWTFDAGAPLKGPIVPASDGHVYFIARDSRLHAIDASGHEVFSRPAGGLAPAVSPAGTVFVRGTAKDLYALGADGQLQWRVEVGRGSGPVLASQDAVYVSAGRELLAATAPGVIAWSVPVGNVTTAAAITGGLVVAADGGAVTAITASGTVLWSFSPPGGFSGMLAAGASAVYAGSSSGTLYALDPASGTELWHLATAAPVTSGPVVGASGTVYFGSDSLYAMSAGGGLEWNLKSPPAPLALATDGGAGVFYIAADGTASMIDSNSAPRWTTRSIGAVSHVALSASGVLYIATADGHLYALR